MTARVGLEGGGKSEVILYDVGVRLIQFWGLGNCLGYWGTDGVLDGGPVWVVVVALSL